MKDINNEGLLENLDEFKEESEKDLNNFSIYIAIMTGGRSNAK